MKFDVCFLDTNILVYAVDKSAGVKQSQAQTLIAENIRNGTGAISTQVMQESHVATRKLTIIPEMATAILKSLSGLNIVSISPAIIYDAIETQLRWNLSFWDALILQAAIHSNCSILYSEDLNHSQKYGSVKAINPFLSRQE